MLYSSRHSRRFSDGPRSDRGPFFVRLRRSCPWPTQPIRLAWFWLVVPCLLLNYFGQGALVLRHPSAVSNPFSLLTPRVLLYPLIAVETTRDELLSRPRAAHTAPQGVEAGRTDDEHLAEAIVCGHGEECEIGGGVLPAAAESGRRVGNADRVL